MNEEVTMFLITIMCDEDDYKLLEVIAKDQNISVLESAQAVLKHGLAEVFVKKEITNDH